MIKKCKVTKKQGSKSLVEVLYNHFWGQEYVPWAIHIIGPLTYKKISKEKHLLFFTNSVNLFGPVHVQYYWSKTTRSKNIK